MVTFLIVFPLTQVIDFFCEVFEEVFLVVAPVAFEVDEGVGVGEALATGVAVDSGFFIETLIAGFE